MRFYRKAAHRPEVPGQKALRDLRAPKSIPWATRKVRGQNAAASQENAIIGNDVQGCRLRGEKDNGRVSVRGDSGRAILRASCPWAAQRLTLAVAAGVLIAGDATAGPGIAYYRAAHHRPHHEVGIALHVTGNELAISDVVVLCAPRLIFSPREPTPPTLALTKWPVEERPCSGAIVYYQMSKAVQSDGHAMALAPGALLDSRCEWRFEITYFFYYAYDVGLNGHSHDIEALRVGLVSRPREGGSLVRITFVEGLAHGVATMSNVLLISDIDPGEAWGPPLYALVEEGKHAVCPDRDGDGRYMPGYDVTWCPQDAWGVRDVTRTGRVGGACYRAEMTRLRDPLAAIGAKQAPLFREDGSSVGSGVGYTLVPTESVDCATLLRIALEVAGRKGESEQWATGLVRLMERNRVGKWNESPHGFSRRSRLQQSSLHARFDGGYWGLSFVTVVPIVSEFVPRAVFDVPIVGGILGSRAALVWRDGARRVSLGLYYVGSGARYCDWYAEVGGEVEQMGSDLGWDLNTDGRWRGAGEIGMRWRTSWPIGLCSGRLGLRSSACRGELQGTRLVIEIGTRGN